MLTCRDPDELMLRVALANRTAAEIQRMQGTG